MIWTTHNSNQRPLFLYGVTPQPDSEEWLSQLLIYVGYRFGGYSGIMLGSPFLLLLCSSPGMLCALCIQEMQRSVSWER